MTADVDQGLGNGDGASQRVDPLGPQSEELTGPQSAVGGKQHCCLVGGSMAASKARTSVESWKRISVLSMRGSRIPSQGDLINNPAWTAAFMILPSICAAFVVLAGRLPPCSSRTEHGCRVSLPARDRRRSR
jgi:hypothetical protein